MDEFAIEILVVYVESLALAHSDDKALGKSNEDVMNTPQQKCEIFGCSVRQGGMHICWHYSQVWLFRACR